MTLPEERLKEFRRIFFALEEEVGRVIVGHYDAIRKVLIAFFAGGHVLIEGVPGLGKTLMVKSLSQALGLSFKRIQFTPDLMPSDIVGTQVLADGSGARTSNSSKDRCSPILSWLMKSTVRPPKHSRPSLKRWKNTRSQSSETRII